MNSCKTILVVEDEPDLMAHLIILLNSSGYKTVAATNGVEAYSMAFEKQPDLIVLDIIMPRQSGLRTYKQYKTHPILHRIPVIITTASGRAMQRYIEKQETLPQPEGFMFKPIDEDRLLQMIEDLL